MTTPKVATFTRYGDRWYRLPSDESVVAPGVSSIKGMHPKDLSGWRARSAAEFAVHNIKAVYELAGTDPSAAINLVKGASYRYSGKAADAGTEVHSYVEEIGRAMIAGKKFRGQVPRHVVPFLRNYARFVREFDFEPIMLETTVWHDEPGQEYAGTFDALGRLRKLGDALCIVDTKSGASGVYPEAAIQQTAYKNARWYVDQESGELRPMPTVDATYALWLRGNGWALIPLVSDERVWEHWRRLRETYTFVKQYERKLVLPAINENPIKKVWKPR